MIYRGKKIVIELNDGRFKVFRGSAYTLEVTNGGHVSVYNRDGLYVFCGHSNEIKEVIEGNYTGESL